MKTSLIRRVVRMVSGTAHHIVDAAEDLAPKARMEQAVREIKNAIKELEKARGHATARRHLAQQRLAHENERHEAENLLNERMVMLREKLAIAERMPEIVRESVRPLDNIEGIKIVHLGEPSNSYGPSAIKGGPTSEPDAIVESALRYRVHAPLIDAMLKEIGLNGPTLSGLAGSTAGGPASAATTTKEIDAAGGTPSAEQEGNR